MKIFIIRHLVHTICIYQTDNDNLPTCIPNHKCPTLPVYLPSATICSITVSVTWGLWERFEVFTAVTMKNCVFWVVTLMRRRQVPPKRRFLQEPHGVTTQKTPFFMGKFGLCYYHHLFLMLRLTFVMVIISRQNRCRFCTRGSAITASIFFSACTVKSANRVRITNSPGRISMSMWIQAG
jgi:hypothetical protein